MTSRLPDTSGEDTAQEFLVLDYDSLGFLIHRNKCASGVYPEQVRTMKSPVPYLDSFLEFSGAKVLMFDLDAWLREKFSIETEPSIHVALVAKVSSFSSGNQEIFASIVKAQSWTLSNSLLAFKTSGAVRTEKGEASRVRRIPPGLRRVFLAEGILGCTFDYGDALYHFVDIEKVFFNVFHNFSKRRLADKVG